MSKPQKSKLTVKQARENAQLADINRRIALAMTTLRGLLALRAGRTEWKRNGKPRLKWGPTGRWIEGAEPRGRFTIEQDGNETVRIPWVYDREP